MALTDLSITALVADLKAKKISATEVVNAYAANIEKYQGLNAYVLDTLDHARAQAKQSDEKLKRGEGGLLEGVPVGVKDLFCTKNFRTTACSKILENFVPTYESTVTANLFAQGAIMPGKTNMDEFAMGSANIHSCFGNVKNPWKAKDSDKDLVPGGSSGGSAAAVAAHLCAAALGSDTGGSIRQPAAYTGTVGIKPTYGRCSRWGMIAFASSLDQAGVFARNVKDAALVQQAISGFDAKDSTSYNAPVPEWSANINTNLKGKKIGIPKEYRVEGTDPEILAWWDKGIAWLKDHGAEIQEVSLPHTSYALATYYIIAPAEASSNLARYDGVRYGLRAKENIHSLDDMYELTRAAGFGKEVKRRILIGTYVLSAGYYDAYYKKAQRIRTLIAQDFAKAFEKVDALLAPTAPTAAFALGEKMDNPITMYLNDIYTVPASMAGLPAMSVPAGLSSRGLPLGLQIIGKAFDEQSVFNVAAAVEESAKFTARPAGF